MTARRLTKTQDRGHVVELFAGVGGFRVGLERSGWKTVWANQWEPSTKAQHAADCYRRAWDDGTLVNADVATVLNEVPEHDLLVGGFPCQDYSVAKTLNQAQGIEGKKGVLWWSIYSIVDDRHPRWIILENVDRLLKSPAAQRGRDFAIILACLADLGYTVEWRVVNASEYGFPQKRRRVFIVAHRDLVVTKGKALSWLYDEGVLARALPVLPADDIDSELLARQPDLTLNGHPAQITQEFGWMNHITPFRTAGVMSGRKVWTRKIDVAFDEKKKTLGDILIPEADVPDEFYIRDSQLPQWQYLKGPKREERVAANGHVYHYSEGGVPFPDRTDIASRTILTGEGGTSPSRFKHVVTTSDGRYRRLTPVELERLNGFADDWTAGMPDGRRAFMMGNALVVGVVERIGKALLRTTATESSRSSDAAV